LGVAENKSCTTCAQDRALCEKCRVINGTPTQFVAKNTPKTPESVNHPAHYATGKFECIDVMAEIYGVEATQTFCLLNAFKYLYRCNGKGKKSEDIKKANWYLNKYIEIERGTK
jgi:hypothetical protein